MRVTIVQYRMLHYRIALFDRMRQLCADRGIELEVVFGQATPYERAKKDEADLAWGRRVHNRIVRIGAKDLVWQPLPRSSLRSDLIVVMQENRLLSNYPLLLRRLFNGPKVAYWGHGANFQSHRPAGLRERWKSWLIKRVDWWFAYTELSADIVRRCGFPESCLTILNNAIDNETFRQDLLSVQTSETREEQTAIFCGSLYPEKRLDFLVRSGDLIAARLPNFRLYLVGDGPDRDVIIEAAATRPWLIWCGALHGRDKAAIFSRAQVVLNPGLVGLHVLDAFCAGLPMITTSDAQHSPEIAYLENEVNGVLVDGDETTYADAAIDLLLNRSRLVELQKGAAQAAQAFTLDNMAKNFTEGIARCCRR